MNDSIVRTVTAAAPSRRLRVFAICALAVAATVAAFSVPPFTRPAAYYDFADRREILGIPNFMDVMSNAPWAVIGVLGLWFIARTRAGRPDAPFFDAWERSQFAALFAGLLLIAAGSSYFHLTPGVPTLVWDRLPMTVAFMSLFSIVIGERIDRRAGRLLFPALLALGIGSVLYWRYTELLGRGDERLYLLVQFFPMLALPVILLLFPSRFGRTGDLVLVLGWYGVAKLFELADDRVFGLTGGLISGHTLKHLAGVLASVWLLRMMRLRRPMGGIFSHAP